MTLAYPYLTSLSRQESLPSASSSPSNPSKLNHITKATYKSFQQPPFHWSYSTPSHYIDATPSTASALGENNFTATRYMQNDPSYYPEVRVQQSTPNHGLHGLPSSTPPPPPLLLDESDYSSVPWNYQDASYLVPNSQQQCTPTSYRSHKRLSSGSSIGSTGPDSPYTQSSTYPRIVDSDTQSVHSAHLDPFDGSIQGVGQYPKANFALSAQNNDQSFYPQFESFSLSGNNAASMMAVQAGSRNQGQNGTSVTTGGKNTERGAFGGDGDSSTVGMQTSTPQLDRTMSDIYQDELFNPAMSAPSSQPRPSVNTQGNLVSPQMSAFNDILQAANNGHLTARSASPAVNVASRRSPFRDTSQYAQAGFQSNPNSPASRLISASRMREQQKMEEAYAQTHHPSRHDFMNATKTISPKEALLDYNESEEDSKLPLFPSPKREPDVQQQSTSLYDRPLARLNTENSTDQSYPSMATSRCQSSSKQSTSPAPPSSGSNYHFLPPSVAPLQQYPFISQSRRQSSSMRSGSDQVPEFPASLPSMESTKSEAGQPESVRLIPEHSSPSSQEAPIRRPLDTSAHSGTYTCTGTDCHARFDTAGKLQKHRREAHRASPIASSTPTTPLSATIPHNQQAAANNISRNNQPGPHKCERMNPSTGKPCNTIFSRSYDLTRHEDTIHSNRKQKVRCHLCTEEKTFSRNDALTRHMRVVHPDVDFPGKTRRGRNSEGVDVVRQRIEGGRGGR